MKNILFLQNYNNYYDRKVKKLYTIEEYIELDSVAKMNVNFVYGDGITSTLTMNWADNWNPDYMVVFDETNTILSRWFVLEAERILNGQFKISVRRDVIADKLEEIQTAPVFVMKGNLEKEDPLIFNNESMTYNEIKVNETLLKDETDTAWIVGYMAKGHSYPAEGTTFTANIGSVVAPDIGTIEMELVNPANPSEGAYAYSQNQDMQFPLGIETGTPFWMLGRNITTATAKYNYYDTFNMTDKSWAFKVPDGIQIRTKKKTVENFLMETFMTNMTNTWYNKLNEIKSTLPNAIEAHFSGVGKPILTKDEYLELSRLHGKLVYSSATSKYYRLYLSLDKIETGTTILDPADSYNTSLIAVLNTARYQTKVELDQYDLYDGESDFRLKYNLSKWKITLVETAGPGTITLTVKNSHAKVEDAPYNIFAMPYTKENMAMINTIIQTYTVSESSPIYDIQILPYCPARYMLDEDGVNLTYGTVDINYNLVKLGAVDISYMLWATSSSDTFIIPNSIPSGITADEVKVINETEFIRLNSPNYNGSFDFNVAKNGGVDFFRVSYTYKPYSPYIQVAPNFKGLYGQEFGDARGLICNGDFSIAITTDAWKSYELNNKNFQNIFDTEVKTMDYAHKMGMMSQGISSTVGAAGVGLGAGLMTGNPAIGVGVGVASAAGGVADLAIGNSIYQSNKQGQKDIFNYNLGNIKARPDALTKVSAYNINNKYFPFVEFYSATDAEKEILREKIKYEGMTVMTVSTMLEFMGRREEFNFFKGQLIQNGNIAEDFHFIDAISVELEKGVYL